MILLDIPPSPFSDPVSISAGIGFFFILAAVAAASFFLLKRYVRVGFRLLIGTVILLIAVIGSIIVSFIVANLSYTPHIRPRLPTPGVSR